MPPRALHWLVLCFATLWFSVLVPVHNRGEIRLPGAAPAPEAVSSHCHRGATDDEQAPCHDRARESGGACAVCYFLAALDAPPPVTLVEARLGFVGLIDAPRPDTPVVAGVSLPFHSRGPPRA